MSQPDDSSRVAFLPLRDAEWAACLLAVTKARVYQLAREGVLPCVRLGRQIRFDERALRAWVEGGGQRLAESD